MTFASLHVPVRSWPHDEVYDIQLFSEILRYWLVPECPIM